VSAPHREIIVPKKLDQIAENVNAYTLRFDGHLLDEVRSLWEQVAGPTLSDPANAHLLAGGKRVDLELGSGESRLYVTSFGEAPLLWLSNDNDQTYAIFERFFRSLEIDDDVKELVDHDERIQVYCGFFVVGNVAEQSKWHVDYQDGANGYTLITPLYELDEQHGHLIYQDANEKLYRYVYEMDELVLFGEGFPHTTEPYPKTEKLRVLLSLTLGTDKLEHWEALQSIAGQSRYMRLPCGHVRGTCACLEGLS
jgi:hypothetical protein